MNRNESSGFISRIHRNAAAKRTRGVIQVPLWFALLVGIVAPPFAEAVQWAWKHSVDFERRRYRFQDRSYPYFSFSGASDTYKKKKEGGRMVAVLQ